MAEVRQLKSLNLYRKGWYAIKCGFYHTQATDAILQHIFDTNEAVHPASGGTAAKLADEWSEAVCRGVLLQNKEAIVDVPCTTTYQTKAVHIAYEQQGREVDEAALFRLAFPLTCNRLFLHATLLFAPTEDSPFDAVQSRTLLVIVEETVLVSVPVRVVFDGAGSCMVDMLLSSLMTVPSGDTAIKVDTSLSRATSPNRWALWRARRAASPELQPSVGTPDSPASAVYQDVPDRFRAGGRSLLRKQDVAHPLGERAKSMPSSVLKRHTSIRKSLSPTKRRPFASFQQVLSAPQIQARWRRARDTFLKAVEMLATRDIAPFDAYLAARCESFILQQQTAESEVDLLQTFALIACHLNVTTVNRFFSLREERRWTQWRQHATGGTFVSLPVSCPIFDGLPNRLPTIKANEGNMSALWEKEIVEKQGNDVPQLVRPAAIRRPLNFAQRTTPAIEIRQQNNPSQVHYVIFVHGLAGRASDLRFLRTAFLTHSSLCTEQQSDLPLRCLSSRANQAPVNATLGDIIQMGRQLAAEVVEWVGRMDTQDGTSGKAPTEKKIHFVAHSLGALIVRTALMDKSFASYLQPHLGTFVSLCAPHLGIHHCTNHWVAAGIALMRRQALSIRQMTGHDKADVKKLKVEGNHIAPAETGLSDWTFGVMSMVDAAKPEAGPLRSPSPVKGLLQWPPRSPSPQIESAHTHPLLFLEKLSYHDGLSWFDEVILFANRHDGFVPFDSALIKENRAKSKHKLFETVEKSTLHHLQETAVLRLEVDFTIPKRLGSWEEKIGRAGHILVLEDSCFAGMLAGLVINRWRGQQTRESILE